MFFHRFIVATLLIVLSVLFQIDPARAESRVALVIGNNNYDFDSLPDLKNAARDATDLGQSLEKLGFEVIVKIDANELEMGRAIRQFSDQARKAKVGLIYYSGHGIQHQGVNWLVPTDAHVEMAADLETQAFDSAVLVEALANARAEMNILILDACRNNPLPVQDRDSANGLARQALPSDIRDMAILFSAGDGQVAQDGPPGENGIFTGELIKLIDKPGLRLEDLFKQTARQVSDATNASQIPFFYSNSQSDFYFAGNAPSAGDGKNQADSDKEALFWQSVRDSHDKAELDAYLKQYPEGTFAPLARARLKALSGGQSKAKTAEDPEITMWKSINHSEDEDDFQDYLEKYPTGTFAGLAKARLSELTTASLLGDEMPSVPEIPGNGAQPAAETPTAETKAAAVPASEAQKPQQPAPAKPAAQQPVPKADPAQPAGTKLAAVTPAQPDSPKLHVTPRGNAVTVRRSTKGGRIDVLRNGTNALVLNMSKDGFWYYVQMPSGKKGFVYKGLVREVKAVAAQQPATEPATLTAAAQPAEAKQQATQAAPVAGALHIAPRYNKSVNLRRSPNGGAKIGLFKKGTQARVLSKTEDGKWYKIEAAPGLVGYVWHSRVRELKPGEVKK